MLRRRILVGVEADVVRVAASDRDPGRVEHELGVLVDRVAPEHDETAHLELRLGPETDGRGLLRREDEALLRDSEVTARCSHDAPDEEIEKDEERGLQEEEGPLHVDRCEDHADCRKTSSVEPTVIRSSFASFARCWRRPLTMSPFVEPRSRIQYAVPSWRSSACRRETFGSASRMSQSFERPISVLSLSIECCLPFASSVTT